MDDPAIRLRIDHLTQLDRLELDKALAAGPVAVQVQATPVAAGRLGEPGELTAYLVVTLATIDAVGLALAVWLAKGGRKSSLKDHIVIETPQGRMERTLVITSSAQEQITPEIVRQLREALPGSDLPPSPPGTGV